jgi:hypothetical protein
LKPMPDFSAEVIESLARSKNRGHNSFTKRCLTKGREIHFRKRWQSVIFFNEWPYLHFFRSNCEMLANCSLELSLIMYTTLQASLYREIRSPMDTLREISKRFDSSQVDSISNSASASWNWVCNPWEDSLNTHYYSSYETQ